MTGYDEEQIADLLRLLPAAPEAWVRAAQELPRARASLEGIVARAEADAAFRAGVLADLEAGLAAEGIEPSPVLLAELRRRLAAG
ncbi:MAG: hypothetical protein ACYDCH_04865 [Gaiellaceae bacterium]